MRSFLGALCVVTSVALALSCIPSKYTVEAHITVDIRQRIEQQAQGVLDFVENKTPAPVPQVPAPATPAPAPKKSTWLDGIYNAISPMQVAYAQGLKETSPKITEIATRLKERQPQVDALKTQKAAGEDNRGYLALRSSASLADPAKKNEAQKLIGAQNADWKALYQEVVNLNMEQRVSLSDIERIFAQKRLERANPGDIFQLPASGKDFDAFKTSAKGKALGSECVPNAWVVIK